VKLVRRHRVKIGAVVLVAGGLIAALGVQAIGASSQTASNPEGFVGVSPTRVLDTRTPPVGVAAAGPVGPGGTVDLPLTSAAPNRPGIPVPAGAVSVLLNITVDSDATAPSFITVWPTGSPKPTTSVINPNPGTVVSGSILVPLGTGGSVSIFNFDGQSNVIVDLAGYTLPLTASGGVTIFDSDPAASTTADVQTDFGDFTGGTLIRDLTLPAGSYEITATATVRGASDGPAAPTLNTRVRCNLVDATANPAASLDTFYNDFFQPDNDSPGFREPLQVGALTTFGVDTKVELRCYSVHPGGGTNAGLVPSSKIVARQVATITAGH
jgi:hypothetical protein